MRLIGNFFSLIPLFFRVKNYFWKEERSVRCRFYSNREFYLFDRALKKAYRFKNPYRMAKQFLIRKGEREVDLYGETPLTTLFQIATTFHVQQTDHVIELGCGRGRGCGFLRWFIGCRVTGVEWIPDFVERSALVAAQDVHKRLNFQLGDFLKADFSQAQVIYLYGTCLEEEFILRLIDRFLELDPHTKIITVSFPLSDYSSSFRIADQLVGSFPWGETDVFLNLQVTD